VSIGRSHRYRLAITMRLGGSADTTIRACRAFALVCRSLRSAREYIAWDPSCRAAATPRNSRGGARYLRDRSRTTKPALRCCTTASVSDRNGNRSSCAAILFVRETAQARLLRGCGRDSREGWSEWVESLECQAANLQIPATRRAKILPTRMAP